MSTTSVGIKLSVSGDAEVKNALAGVDRSMGNIAKSTGSAMDALRAFAPVFAGAVSAGAFVKAADAVTTLNNQLRLATGSTQAATQAYNALFDIAQRSRVSFTELGSTFASISRAGQALGLSQERLLGVTEAIGNAMTISGGSAESMKAALVQLGQGLASGTLRGEELNSVMEQTPRLAKALADGLGVSIGKLREMGAAGQLTGEQVIKALESQSQVLSGEVQGAVLTVGQAFTQLQNASIKAAGDMDRATGATSALASGLQGLSGVVQTVGEAFKNNEAAIQTTLGLLAGATVAAGLARTATALGTVAGGVGAVSTSVTVLKGVVASLNPATLALLGLGAAVGYANSQAGNLDNLKAKLQELQAYGNAAGEFGQATPETKAQTAARLAEIERLKAAIKAYGEEAAQANFLAIGGNGERALREANAKAAASYDDLRVRLSGFKGDYEKYVADLARIQAGMASGDISQKQGIAWLTELALKHGEVGKAVGSRAAKEVEATESAKLYASAMQELVGSSIEAEAAAAGYTKTQKELLEIFTSPGFADMPDTWKQSIVAQAEGVIAAERLAEANKGLGKAMEEARKAAAEYGKQLDAIALAGADLIEQANDRTQAVEDQVAATEFELSLMGKSNTERAIALKQYQIERDLKRDISKINETIASQEDKDYAIDAAKRAANRAKANAAAEVVNTEFQRVSQQIEQSLTDALMRGFESGKDFAANLRDTVINMFKTLVLRPIVSAVVNPIAGAITGSLGLAGVANAGTSGTSALSSIGSLASLSSAFGAGGAAGFGALMGGGFTEAVSAGFTTLLTGGSVGTAAAGLGTLAGALGPIALGLGALSSLIGKTGGESRWGGQYGYNFGSGLINNRRGTAVENAVLGVNRLEGANTFAEAEVQAAISGTVGSINALLKSAGSSAALVGFQAGLETSGKGRGGVFAGGKLSTGATFGESGQGDNYAGTLFETTSTQSPDSETALKNFTLDLQQVTIQALQAATDIPEALKKLVQGVDAENLTAEAAAALLNTVQAQISAVEQLNTAFASIGWETFTQGAYDATVALAEASGGFDALSQNLVGYYQNFYTEAERTALATAQVEQQMAALGQSMPATRDGFRALVESAQASGDTALLAGLLNLQGAFAAITQSADEAAQAAYSAAERLANQQQGLFKTWLQTIGDTAQLRAIELAELNDAHSQFIQQSIWDYQDQQAAAEKAAQAAAEYTEALQEQQAFLAGIARNVREWMDGRNSTAGTPTQNLGSARAAFDAQLALAQAGNRDALSGITGYADRLISAGEQRLGYMEGRQLSASVMQQVASLPVLQPADDPMLAVLNSIALSTSTTATNTGADKSLAFDADDPLRSVWAATKEGAGKTAELLEKATNGTLGMYVSLSRQHNADGVLDIGTTLWRAASLWGGDSPRVQVVGTLAAAGSAVTALPLPTAASSAGVDMNSGAGAQTAVDKVFAEMLGRAVDPTGALAFAGMSEADIRAAVAASPEYKSKNKFATGGAFTNGIVNRPTMFDMAQMGEAGPEAIMPLANIGGSLGVRYAGPDFSDFGRGFEAMAAEIKALRIEVAQLRAVANSSATSNALAADSLRSINRDGVQVLGTGDAAAPAIKVEVITP